MQSSPIVWHRMARPSRVWAPSTNAKSAAVEASGDHTVKGSVFDAIRGYRWPDPCSIRSLRNRFFSEWENRVDQLRKHQEDHHAAFVAAQSHGDVAIAPVIVGEAVDLVRGIEPAVDIVRRIAAEPKTASAGLEQVRRSRLYSATDSC